MVGAKGAKGVKISPKIKKELLLAINMRARAKALEVEAKALGVEAKDILLPLMTAYSIKDYTVEGVGKVSVKTSKGSSINASKLREEMLIHGVDIDTIETIMKVATKSWSTEYIGFLETK